MAVSIASIAGTFIASVGAVTSLTTGAFIITGGPNRAGTLHLSVWDTATRITAISGSIGGTGGAAITGTDSTTSRAVRSLMFGVTAPPSGSRTATMGWTTAVQSVLGVITTWGVDQTTPLNNGTFAHGSSTAPSVAVTSNVGDLTVDCDAGDGISMAGDATAPTQTSRWSTHDSSFTMFGFGSRGRGAGTTTHTWTIGPSSPWTASGANFKSDGVNYGGGLEDDRFRFRYSTVIQVGGRPQQSSPWPVDARDLGWRDTVEDNRTRML